MCEACVHGTESVIHEALKKKAHLHHYQQVEGMEKSCFTETVSSLSTLIEEYNQLDDTKSMPIDLLRLSIAV
ncbi:hypothetical protein MC885_012534 [Smutsia gigantea]|nr:hypothetical protein MC885_012534 [Smutsia gigantea]